MEVIAMSDVDADAGRTKVNTANKVIKIEIILFIVFLLSCYPNSNVFCIIIVIDEL